MCINTRLAAMDRDLLRKTTAIAATTKNASDEEFARCTRDLFRDTPLALYDRPVIYRNSEYISVDVAAETLYIHDADFNQVSRVCVMGLPAEAKRSIVSALLTLD